MKLKTKIQQKVVAFILLCGLLCNPLTVNAEENADKLIPEEEIVIIDNSESITQETTKNFANIEHEFFVGENMDINVMPMADADNTDADNARIIPVNSIVNDAITEDGQQRWYAFAANAGKLTLDLNFTNSSNVDYDIYLFQYNDAEGIIAMIDGMESTDNIEHFSRMIEGGVYFVMVNGYSGHDAVNQYSLSVVLSVYYDSQEADDRLQDAYSFTNVDYSVTGTIDNKYDIDIQKYVINSAGRLNIYLKNNNSSSNNVYKVDILGPNGYKLATLNQDIKYNVDLPQGTFYFKVYCSTYGNDYNSTYTLSGDTRVQAARVVVTHAGDAAEPIKDYVNGPYWRVFPNSYVEGIAYDSAGRPLAYADVVIKITIKYNNLTIPASGRTDSQGRFKIQLDIGYGQGTYNTSVSGVAVHFYDIVPVTFESNGAPITSDVQYFYHFAYEYLLKL